VGTGVDVGKPPVQKALGSTLVFLKEAGQIEFGGKKYGPFSRGDLTNGLPPEVVATLEASGSVGIFSYEMLAGELLS